MKKIILFILGLILIALGMIGWLLPFMPGWLFVLLGLSFIAPKLAERLKQRLYRKFSRKEVVYLEDWKKFGVDAGFTTRHFPLFVNQTDQFLLDGIQESFIDHFGGGNLPPPAGRASAGRQAPSLRFVFLNQIHGDRIAILDDESKYRERGFYHLLKTDGVLTSIPDLALLVLTADCLPVFLSAGPWIGLVHAGWRGTKEKIAEKAFQVIVAKSGCAPKDVRVVFGPCIGAEQYEVGPEFKDYFSHLSLKQKNKKIYFDLAKENKRQLTASGALSGHIFETGICTVSENENFYSFRKEKNAAGRMIAFIVKR